MLQRMLHIALNKISETGSCHGVHKPIYQVGRYAYKLLTTTKILAAWWGAFHKMLTISSVW